MSNLSKLFTALITPFDDKGNINFSEFSSLVEQNLKHNINLLLFGSTGESINLLKEEKIEMLKIAIDIKKQCKSNSLIFVGTPNYDMITSIKWIEIISQYQEIDGYLLAPPLYSKAGIYGVANWFNLLSNSLKENNHHYNNHQKIMLYNIPSRVGYDLNPKILELIENKNLIFGLKESGQNLNNIDRFITSFQGLNVLAGDDFMLTQMIKHGAKGLVSVISNIMPEIIHKYLNLTLSQNLTKEIEETFYRLTTILSKYPNPLAIKNLMKEIGIISSSQVRLPLSLQDLKITKEEISEQKSLLAKLNILINE